ISAHWESTDVAINGAEKPALIFDYYGFPPHTYQLEYPAPGAPALATRIEELLQAATIPCHRDPGHGFDHGVFIPFLLIYPQARIPIVQISLRASLNPVEHLAIGQALLPLRQEGVLIVGSGMSYHNMAALMKGRPANGDDERFDHWLHDAVSADAATREQRLTNWSTAPGARGAHPREEHLLPLMVVAGAAGDDRGRRIFTDRVLRAQVSAFQFGG
ncbi:MAG: DODA-type extradiol aromatic ring-opening family dioxygenase, partial [Porticoccaceae bacterium]